MKRKAEPILEVAARRLRAELLVAAERAASIFTMTLWVIFASSSAAFGDDQSRGEIRLLAPLSSLSASVAVAPDQHLILVSEVDGSVASLDPNSSDTSARQILLSAPIRDEEFQRQHPVALSPSADIIALGAPAERNKPNSARIYFFRRSDPSRIIYTLDGLPSRPTALEFTQDGHGERILLAAAFAEGQPARIWNVTKIVDSSRDLTVEPTTPPMVILPSPSANFFSDCGRKECHSWAVAFPPESSSSIGLVVGADSGLIIYDRKFAVSAYGFWRDEDRFDLRRIASVAFSPDGKRLAVGKYALDKYEEPSNFSCRVDVYDTTAITTTDDSKRLRANPLSLPVEPHLGDGVCTLAHVVWTNGAIFAAGEYVRPPLDKQCRTFQNLDRDYAPYANTMVRWQSTEASPAYSCVGTNSAIDLRSFGDGVVIASQDPSITIYDSTGNPSHYSDQPDLVRRTIGPVLDLRDTTRGELTVNEDATLVFFRPLEIPSVYVGFDLTPPLPFKPVEAARNDVIDAAREAIRSKLKKHRETPVDFSVRTMRPDRCLEVDVAFPPTQPALIAMTGALKKVLKLRPPEMIRSLEFLPPAENAGSVWRVVLGTSHRLLYLGCDGRDWFHGGRNVSELDFPGVPVRSESYQVRVSGNKRFVVVAHADGMLRWYRMSSGQNILSVFVSRNLQSWVAWSADGYFDHSDDIGGQIAGWLQSTVSGKGIWTIKLEPLTQHETDWRKPSRLRGWITGSVNDAAEIPVPTRAPGSDKPSLFLQILNTGKLRDPIVRLRVRIANFAGALAPSPITIGVQGMGTVKLSDAHAWQQGDDSGIEGFFELDKCLWKKGRPIQIWAQFSDSALDADPTITAFPSLTSVEYDGESSDTQCDPGKVWAVAVGISKYDDKSLEYADQDAERFVSFWRNQSFYHVGRIALLKAPLNGPAIKTVYGPSGPISTETPASADSKTVRKMLRDEVAAIQTEIKPTDLLLIYLAGHGMSFFTVDLEHFYFLPSDAQTTGPDTLDGTAIDATWLGSLLNVVQMNKQVPIVIFIDACRNLQNHDVANPPNNLDFNSGLSSFNTTVVLATGPGGRAYEFPQHDLDHPKNPNTCEASDPHDATGGGAFTYALLNILSHSDKRANLPMDGSIPLFELMTAVSSATKRICEEQRVRPGKISQYFPGFFRKQ